MSKFCLMMVAGERSGDLCGAGVVLALPERLHDPELFGGEGET